MGATRRSTCRPRFLAGDLVEVLRACRLPKIEEVIGAGVIEDTSEATNGETLYWITGFKTARTVREIRLVRSSRISEDNHLLVHPRKTLSEAWAEEDEERRGEE